MGVTGGRKLRLFVVIESGMAIQLTRFAIKLPFLEGQISNSTTLKRAFILRKVLVETTLTISTLAPSGRARGIGVGGEVGGREDKGSFQTH